ncbi:MAG: ATP cone domain-containing protein [Aquificaceae bacterium]|nr:ATP cone domain-containing protein [Aquificaceae bacterium]MDM7267358.1 ATP cone domain-containing protein [Aquificaceae bacterium]
MLKIESPLELKKRYYGQLPQVIKRDGTLQEFDRSRIERAISKAFKAVGEPLEEGVLKDLCDEVIEKVLELKKDKVHVEEIQDIVEERLILHGFAKTAKAYILYRKKGRSLETYQRP